jgi:hypothetical protein
MNRLYIVLRSLLDIDNESIRSDLIRTQFSDDVASEQNRNIYIDFWRKANSIKDEATSR